MNLRTKLCIRDSLYRLARSAEERHDGSKMDCGSRDDSNSSEEFKAKTNEYVITANITYFADIYVYMHRDGGSRDDRNSSEEFNA